MSSSIIRAKVATLAVRQKCAKLTPTASQASASITLGLGCGDLVFLAMALLSIAGSTPRAYGLKLGTADGAISTLVGAYIEDATMTRYTRN